MKKFLKLGKRMMALFIVVLLNINTYAAIGGNDGSAFVTKAEFDALINTFNEQMDSYQSGLNAKIDGAIANYLAGLSSVSRTVGNIITSGWNDVSCMNGVVDPTFTYPSLNIMYGGLLWGRFNGTNEYKLSTIAFTVRYLYNQTSGMTRALCTTKGDETTASSSYQTIYWAGVASNYMEKYAANANVYNMSNTSGLYAIENDWTKRISVNDCVNIYIPDGYAATIADRMGTLAPNIKYEVPDYDVSTTLNFTTKLVGCEPTISYTDTIKYLDHMVAYNKNVNWCLSNASFNHTFRTHASNTYGSSGALASGTSKYGSGAYTAARIMTTTTTKDVASVAMSLNHIVDTNVVYPSIGMLKNDVSASNIMLTSDTYNVEYANRKLSISDVPLYEGLPLLAAAKATTIEWSPRFVKGKAKSSGAWIDSSATRAKLLLSIGPFTNKIDSSNIINGSSDIGTTSDGGILCKICVQDTDEPTKVTFKMPTDGVVYAKWVPDTSDYESASWYQPIDLTQSNTYIATTE